MKALKTVVILVILFGLPAGSWYFLKYGFNWRKEKLENLEIKGQFLNDLDWTHEQKEELYGMLFYKTSVIKSGAGISEDEAQIIDQFKNSYSFQWVNMTGEGDSIPDLQSRDIRKSFPGLVVLHNDPLLSRASYILIDTAMHIRRVYNEKSEETYKEMTEDLTIVIPPRKEKDISIKK